MERFAYLLKKRTRALGLFTRIVAKLVKLEREICQHMLSSQKKIDEAKSVISEEGQAINFLQKSLTETQAHRGEIEKFLPRG